MIGEDTLERLCKKYNISKEKLIKKNNSILTYGEFNEIDKTLNYLVNELKIPSINIEKCPSILYKNVEQIRQNVNFLNQQEIDFTNIESCLHVLSTDCDQLIQTYNYVKEKYSIEAINKNTSILGSNVEIIKSVEELGLDKEYNLTISVSIAFGGTTIEEVQKIVESDEFKAHPELFTSQTLAYAKIEDIQKIIRSEEFKAHPELFTSQTLAHAKIEDVQKLLNLSYFKEEKYAKLLTSSIVADCKTMVKKIPVLIEMAENYKIDRFINTNFLLKSPSQNYALINYLEENNVPLIMKGKLNPVFSYQPGTLKKKYGIDLKVLMKIYPMPEKSMGGKSK